MTFYSGGLLFFEATRYPNNSYENGYKAEINSLESTHFILFSGSQIHQACTEITH